MRSVLLAAAAAAIATTTSAAYAQSTDLPPSSGGPGIVTPPSTGMSSGDSGSIGSPNSTYPGRLRDFNNPAASYGNGYRAGRPYGSPGVNSGGVIRR